MIINLIETYYFPAENERYIYKTGYLYKNYLNAL